MDKKLDRELKGLPLIWNMPGVWWRRLHWFKRIVVTLIFFGIVSGVSISVYVSISSRQSRELQSLQAERLEEISILYAEMKADLEDREQAKNQEILAELESLRDELSRYRARSGASVLGESVDLDSSIESAIAALESIAPGESSSGEVFGYITISDIKWNSLDAHELRYVSSKSIAKLKYGELYPVHDYESGWYQVDTLGAGVGWVQEQYMKVVSY